MGYVLGYIVDVLFTRTKVYVNTGRDGESTFNPFDTGPSRVSLGDFELNLLSLAAIVIKADGDVSQKELDYVRVFFVRQFGKDRANATFRTFNDVVKNRSVEIPRISAYMSATTTYEMRLEILHFLFGVADADGVIQRGELNVLENIARHLRLSLGDFNSIKAMFLRTADSTSNAYTILEVDKNASETEIKKAYREMVKKYHPDKLVNMDEAYRKGAEEKFRKVQEAYENIRKEKGF